METSGPDPPNMICRKHESDPQVDNGARWHQTGGRGRGRESPGTSGFPDAAGQLRPSDRGLSIPGVFWPMMGSDQPPFPYAVQIMENMHASKALSLRMPGLERHVNLHRHVD